MKESTSTSEALQQLDGLKKKQQGARNDGDGDATVQSTSKSEQNATNRLNRIKSLTDWNDDEF